MNLGVFFFGLTTPSLFALYIYYIIYKSIPGPVVVMAEEEVVVEAGGGGC